MNIPCTKITGIVFLAREFRDFLCARYNVNPRPPQTPRTTVMAVPPALMNATHLSNSKEACSLHVTTKGMKNSSTSLDELSPQHQYAPNL